MKGRISLPTIPNPALTPMSNAQARNTLTALLREGFANTLKTNRRSAAAFSTCTLSAADTLAEHRCFKIQ
jgi:hypothetical protein